MYLSGVEKNEIIVIPLTPFAKGDTYAPHVLRHLLGSMY